MLCACIASNILAKAWSQRSVPAQRFAPNPHLWVCDAHCERHLGVAALDVVQFLWHLLASAPTFSAQQNAKHTLMPAALFADAARPYRVSVGTATTCALTAVSSAKQTQLSSAPFATHVVVSERRHGGRDAACVGARKGGVTTVPGAGSSKGVGTPRQEAGLTHEEVHDTR